MWSGEWMSSCLCVFQEPVSPGASAPTSPTVMETDPVQEEKILTQQISTLRKEKSVTQLAVGC